MSKKIAIIGIGNSLRRDDGIGIEILESLLKFYRQDGVDYLNFGIASFDLIHKIQEYAAVLIIDGINAGLSAGELKIFELKSINYKPENLVSSTHELSLKQLLELIKTLKVKTKVYIAGIQVEDTSYQAGLSAALENKKEEIIKKINTFLKCFPH